MQHNSPSVVRQMGDFFFIRTALTKGRSGFIMVASAKGGVGKSTLCVGLGNVLSECGKKTLLVDMDIGVRSLDLLLNVAEKTVYNWGDVLLNNCDPSKALIGISKNLSLLPAPVSLNDDLDAD